MLLGGLTLADCSSPLIAMTTQFPRLTCLIATDDDAVIINTFEIRVFCRNDVRASRCCNSTKMPPFLCHCRQAFQATQWWLSNMTVIVNKLRIGSEAQLA